MRKNIRRKLFVFDTIDEAEDQIENIQKKGWHIIYIDNRSSQIVLILEKILLHADNLYIPARKKIKFFG